MIVKKITKNCFVNECGQVIFMREDNGKKKKVVLETIDDAISQNYHILDNLLVEIADIYGKSYVNFGEMSEIREVLDVLQTELRRMSYSLDSQSDFDFSDIVERFIHSKNINKRKFALLLSGFTGKEMDILSEAHDSVIRRVGELQGIIKGTIYQIKKMLRIKRDAERKIIYAHDILLICENKLKMTSFENRKRMIERVVKEVAGEKANKVVYALKSVVPVNPYRDRVLSKDILKLEELSEKDDYDRVVKLIRGARSKLKRVVRERDDFEGLNHLGRS